MLDMLDQRLHCGQRKKQKSTCVTLGLKIFFTTRQSQEELLKLTQVGGGRSQVGGGRSQVGAIAMMF